jgi:hypothetical protein
MTDQTLRIGTDRAGRIPMPGLGSGHTQHLDQPQGLRHAVPDGTDTALCGHRPAHVFDGTRWPGIPGRDGHPCPDCLTASKG